MVTARNSGNPSVFRSGVNSSVGRLAGVGAPTRSNSSWLGIFCDGLFSYLASTSSTLESPTIATHPYLVYTRSAYSTLWRVVTFPPSCAYPQSHLSRVWSVVLPGVMGRRIIGGMFTI